MMRATQKGFSLVTAIFLLVVLAGLLGYMVNLSVVQHNTVAMAVRGAQAMQAARSALDYAIFQVLPLPGGGGCAIVAGNVGFIGAGPALAPYNVRLICIESTHIEGVTPFTVYELTAEATSGAYASGANANPDYVSRRIRATVSTPPP